MFANADRTGDFMQTVTVAGNEMLKFIRSRKFLMFGALVVALLALTTLLPYAIGSGISGSAGDVFSNYIGYSSFIVLLGATLFASYTIVSEFEERTALVLFTRPIRRLTIFLGKFVACFVLTAAVMVVYYLVAVAVAFAVTGDLVTSFLPSLAMCLAYVFATTGVAMLISSVMSRGGASAVMTFITILLLVSVVSSVISVAGTDPWFMLDSASNAISNSVPEYVSGANEMMGEIGSGLGVSIEGALVEPADCLRSGAVMLAWGAATLMLSYLAFSRREF